MHKEGWEQLICVDSIYNIHIWEEKQIKSSLFHFTPWMDGYHDILGYNPNSTIRKSKQKMKLESIAQISIGSNMGKPKWPFMNKSTRRKLKINGYLVTRLQSFSNNAREVNWDPTVSGTLTVVSHRTELLHYKVEHLNSSQWWIVWATQFFSFSDTPIKRFKSRKGQYISSHIRWDIKVNISHLIWD